jgi:transglutaminase-like putative cysteine protease
VECVASAPGRAGRLARDSEGQWHGVTACATLAPGEAVTFGWVAEVALLERENGSTRTIDPPSAASLRGDPILCVSDPVIREAADAFRATAASDAPADLARAARRYVGEHVAYELDGGWRPAPDVLEAGRGSCSETTFAVVALCRRLGIPARWTGGTLLRGGQPGRAVDASFHRVAEVWLPGRGYVPVETTSSGDVPTRMLTLSRTEGSDGATGLYYHARNEWRSSAADGRRARPRSTKRAYWVDATHSIAPRGDPLAGLLPGHRASFARCEVLLAESEGYGPPLPPGRLGPAPVRKTSPRRTHNDAEAHLFMAGHPGALRLAHRRAGLSRHAPLVVADMVSAACEPELARDLVALLGRPSAEFESWWAQASKRVAPTQPGLLGYFVTWMNAPPESSAISVR